ncbi:MAG TPA: 50S ribosomal protein L15 [Candidatus Baltobacteraceae bacterium]|jgi:large subunit ribosomal protein L15
MPAAKKTSSAKKTGAKAGSSKAATPKRAAAAKPARVAADVNLEVSANLMTLSKVRPNKGSRPGRVRIGRGHGSGMVKTGGEGGKGQTVRSGGGKGPAFEGGQTPFARRLPQKLGVSQKARDIGHFRTHVAVVNLWELADWDASLEINPQTLASAGKVKQVRDGIKILGGTREGKTLPKGLVFRDVEFSGSAREALSAAGARFEE